MRNYKENPAGDVALRLGSDVLARVDALLPRFQTPGKLPKRSDALRALVLAGLVVEEQKARTEARRVDDDEVETRDGMGAS